MEPEVSEYCMHSTAFPRMSPYFLENSNGFLSSPPHRLPSLVFSASVYGSVKYNITLDINSLCKLFLCILTIHVKSGPRLLRVTVYCA
jgi:hypothetical protein